MGVKVKTSNALGGKEHAALLRTQPPEELPGVEALTYEGAVPVSKLSVQDPSLPSMSVYAHGEINPWNATESMTPAVAFTLAVENPSEIDTMDVSFLLSLPLAIQPATGRLDTIYGHHDATNRSTVAATSARGCKSECDRNATCSAWTYGDSSNVCSLISGGVPQNAYNASITSGVKV